MSNVNWVKAHRDNIHRDLTGSTPHSVLVTHKLPTDIIKPGMVVLDIGIGRGNMAEYIRDKGAVPVCIDVVRGAFPAVSGLAAQVFLTSELEHAAPINAELGICNLVVQHCDDAELRDLLTGVLRHIRKSAFISMQFADKWTCKGNEYLRSPERFAEIVEGCGGECEIVDVEYKWPKYGSMWRIARVKRV